MITKDRLLTAKPSKFCKERLARSMQPMEVVGGHVADEEERRRPSVWCGFHEDLGDRFMQLRTRRSVTSAEMKDIAAKVCAALYAVRAIETYSIDVGHDIRYRSDYVYDYVEILYTVPLPGILMWQLKNLVGEWVEYYTGWRVRFVCYNDVLNMPVSATTPPKGPRWYEKNITAGSVPRLP